MINHKKTPTDVQAMTTDIKNSRILVGNYSGKVYIYDGNEWFETAKQPTSKSISKIAGSPNGDIYVVFQNFDYTYKLFKSTDNGIIWKNVFNTNTVPISAIVINNSGEVFLGTEGNGFYKQDDNTWKQANTGLDNFNILSLASAPNGTLYAGTNGAGIYCSTNNGETWLPPSNYNETHCFGLTIVDDNTIFAAAGTEGVLKSVDGGKYWNQVSNVWVSMVLYNPMTEQIVINDSKDHSIVHRSNDLGASWELKNNSITGYIKAFTFDPKSEKIYIGTDDICAVFYPYDKSHSIEF